jgi:TorA maturation chaperone TorD
MSTSPALSAAAQALVAEAAEWRLIEVLFRCPSPAWKNELQALAREVTDPVLRAAVENAVAEAAEGAFHSIFGPGGPAPAREASYQGTIQLGYLMSELRAYYDAFAYTPSSESSGNEPLDHVSIEAGFMSFLRLKQAFALGGNSETQAMIAAEAAGRFLQEHLSNVAEPMSYALDHSGERYLELAGKALLLRVGPARKQIFDILDEEGANAEDSTFECGAS